MRALTLTQPGASIIAAGVKTTETRGWSTRYRGPLLIHAAKSLGPDGERGYALALRRLEDELDLREWALLRRLRLVTREDGQRDERLAGDRFPRGAVVAYAQLVGTVAAPVALERNPDQEPFGDFAEGRYGWQLMAIKPLPEPVPARGAQRLWRPSSEVVAAASAQLRGRL